MKYYIDTNIFIYSANRKDPHHLSCRKVLELVNKEEIVAVASVLTHEEIKRIDPKKFLWMN